MRVPDRWLQACCGIRRLPPEIGGTSQGLTPCYWLVTNHNSTASNSYQADWTFPTAQIQSGWWLTYPSEKYDFVSWANEIPNIWKVINICSKPPTSNDKGQLNCQPLSPLQSDPASGTPSKKVGNSWARQLYGASVRSWRFLTAMKIHKGFPLIP